MANTNCQSYDFFDIYIENKDIKNGIISILKSIRKNWDLEDIEIKTLANGFLNNVILCSKKLNLEDAVVFKVINQTISFQISLETRFKIERLLSDEGLSPKLVCHFQNGSVHEYIKGRKCGWENQPEFVESETLSRMVMKEMARWHSTTMGLSRKFEKIGIAPDTSFRCTHAEDMISKWPDVFNDPRSKELPTKSVLEEEYQKLTNMVKEMNTKPIFIHGDVHCANVVINESNDAVSFLDYDFCGFDYIEIEFAWFFLLVTQEVGIWLGYPEKEWTVPLIQQYLNDRESLGDHIDDTAEHFYNRIIKWVLFIHFYHLLQCALLDHWPKEAEKANEIDWMGVAVAKGKFYFKTRDEIMAVPNQ